MAKDTAPQTHSPDMSYSDLMSLSLTLHSRIDTLWHRILYAHAAIVGVMVFFATADSPFVLPRVLVFFFYTLNIVITSTAVLESYSGLKAVLADLKTYGASAQGKNVHDWVLARTYHLHGARRVFALGIVWAVLGYLLVYPVLGDLIARMFG